MKVILHSDDGGYLRRSIGFRSEIVKDHAEHDTFAVTGGAFVSPERTMERDWEDATCGPRRRKGTRDSR